ncbi:MAG: endopeptidase La [Candidatus Pacebacteria bacterium CG10_big_fil_rev_8_21_14_0_10_56_10]|nr:MAG: endopeptidase La [Candidatus Pacebacteria bacterium CG10_big_fil_rev_8_21_14_0_10_56_10]
MASSDPKSDQPQPKHTPKPGKAGTVFSRRARQTERTGQIGQVGQVGQAGQAGHNTGQPATSQSDQSPVRQRAQRSLPANQVVLPVVPIREGVLFPSTESVLTFGRKVSVNALKYALKQNKLVVLVTQQKPEVDRPQPGDLFQIGTLAMVERALDSDGQINALARGIGRVRIARFLRIEPFMMAQLEKLEDEVVKDEEMNALTNTLQKEFRKAVHMGKPVEFLNFMKLMGGVTEGELVDQIASTLNATTDEKQTILETLNVKTRIKLVIERLSHEMKVLEIEKDVVHKTQAKFDKHMRENVLRERLRTIQKELGDVDDEEEVVQEYRHKLASLKAPKETKSRISKELKRLQQLSVNNPETGYIRSWLDTIFELPWGKLSQENFDIKKAGYILDERHYGLEKVKDRILEFIAVLQLKKQRDEQTGRNSDLATKLSGGQTDKQTTPTILCFVGPPGVGKTSIGRAVAESLGRKFIKVSLGGIRDEAEIRGHRRTYVGAMAGRIIDGIKQAGTINPVFMLDEVDKVGADFRGDPSAALLEALDPEQNHTFEDHYLDMPFDLSHVMFITTANTLATIPPALYDRLEVIEYSGYTQEEKFFIARDHLMDKNLTANGLTKQQLKFSDQAMQMAIQRYTREAGVRELERTIGKVLRKAARQLVEGKVDTKKINVTPRRLRGYLGPEKYDVTLTEKTDVVGLATGLAWTSVGGDVLFIEVALSPGKGQVKLTGKLGDVMKESAQAAYTYVRANADKLGIKQDKLKKTDVHIHIPEGAVPKDGPSAGITITTAIISAFTNQPVKREVAMTGEVTLRGRVLRIGGLKEKIIAAHRAGSEVVVIPQDNERDLVEVPSSTRNSIMFKPVKTMDQVLKLALK